ncbi:AUGMIN subunit 5 [Linum perenne]
MLESYDQQCDEAAKIFAEYHKRLCYYVNQARDAQKLSADSLADVVSNTSANSEKESVYSTVKGAKSADDVILIETAQERNIRKACEYLAAHMIDRIRISFPAYEGSGIHSSPQLEAAKLGIDLDGEVPDEVRTIIVKEIEKIDVRADAETLRYKFENNRVLEASSPDVSSPLHYQLHGLEGSDAGLASVLESLEFCLNLRGSEASVLEDLAKAINMVHIRQNLVESGHALLNHAYRAQQEYERTTNYCLNLASEQEKIVKEKWLPELKAASLDSQKCLKDCKYVSGLLDEWWEQPASTVVDWVTVDGQNVATWINHVKQLLTLS